MAQPRHWQRRAQQGLAYLMLLVSLAVAGIVAVQRVQAGAIQSQRAQEEELLFAGREIQAALQRYARLSPRGSPRAPRTLEELLQDPRSAATVRHLRRIYRDPMTGQADWVLVRDAQDRILGVHSRSERVPLREAGPAGAVPADGRAFRSYREWVFWGDTPNAGSPPARVGRP